MRNGDMPMALDANPAIATYDAPKKDLYEMGEMPPLGHVPKQMYAWTIRSERHGEPDKAFEVAIALQKWMERTGWRPDTT
jgi:crotonyl-CoA carboxylase/reductase